MLLSNRVAIVTGGARGIGKAIVLELLKQDRIVAVFDLDADQLTDCESQMKQAGFEDIITKCLDITDTAKLKETIEDLAKEYNGVSILVNNAGITRDKLMMQMEENDYDILMNVNLRAAFMATKTALRSMIRNKWGRIIDFR